MSSAYHTETIAATVTTFLEAPEARLPSYTSSPNSSFAMRNLHLGQGWSDDLTRSLRWAGHVAQLRECLLSMHEALGSILSST